MRKLIMGSFCPIIKDGCKRNECVMWKNEEGFCAIALYFGSRPKRETEEVLMQKIPEGIKSAKPEDLALAWFRFAIGKNPNDVGEWAIERTHSNFWANMNIGQQQLPEEIRQKIKETEALAKRLMQNELATRLDKEKEVVEALVSDCISWARIQGLSAVTQDNIHDFLKDKGVMLLPESKRELWKRVSQQSTP
jgi:hypothetical protein